MGYSFKKKIVQYGSSKKKLNKNSWSISQIRIIFHSNLSIESWNNIKINMI